MPYRVGSKCSSPSTKPSLACLSDSEMRRRSRSMSMTLTMTSEPTWTTCSGSSTCRSASSEMCTRPSMPSSTRTNAPNGTSLVTLPGTTCPMAWVRANCRHGSSWVALSDSETRSRSRSMSSTSTVTSWPTSTTSDGWSMCFQDSSETCTRPSTPPRSTKAPKLTTEETTPVRTWPPPQVHEAPEVDDRGADAGPDRALGELVEELAADLGLGLLQPLAAGEDDVVAVLVELDDLGLELAAHVGLQVTDATHLDQRGGEEPAQADVEDETTLDDLDDGAGDDLVGFLLRLDGAPGALVLGALLGQDQAAFLVLLLEDEGFHLVADADDLVGVDVVLDGQLPRGDDALGLVADVQQHLVAVDLDDDALDDVAIVEVLDRLVDRREEVLGSADVVDRALGGAGGTDLGGGHVVGCSGRGMRRDRTARGRVDRGERGEPARAVARRSAPRANSTPDLWRTPMVRTRAHQGPPGRAIGGRMAACHDRRVMSIPPPL